MNISEIESLSDLKGRIVVATKFGHKIINGKRTDWILIENKGYNLKSLPAEFSCRKAFILFHLESCIFLMKLDHRFDTFTENIQ